MNENDSVSTEFRVPAGAPNILLRAVWFVLIGWWLTGILTAAAWALNATIIGLPLGLWIINRLPFAATLHPVERFYLVENGVIVSGVRQRPFLIRAHVLPADRLVALWSVDGGGVRPVDQYPGPSACLLDVQPHRRGHDPLPHLVPIHEHKNGPLPTRERAVCVSAARRWFRLRTRRKRAVAIHRHSLRSVRIQQQLLPRSLPAAAA